MTMTITTAPVDLAVVKALCDALHPADFEWTCATCCDGARARTEAARAVPLLVAEVERLRGEVVRMESVAFTFECDRASLESTIDRLRRALDLASASCAVQAPAEGDPIAEHHDHDVSTDEDENTQDWDVRQLAEHVASGYGSPAAARDVARELLRICATFDAACRYVESAGRAALYADMVRAVDAAERIERAMDEEESK